MLEITLDTEQRRTVENALREAPKRIVPAMVRALNRTARKARTAFIRALRAETTLPAGQIRHKKRGIQLKKANYSNQRAELYFPGREIPVGYFKTRIVRSKYRKIARYSLRGRGRRLKGKARLRVRSGGISFQPRRGGPWVFEQGAFWAVMPSGFRGVFRRRGLKRLPIDWLRGPSLAALARYSRGVQAVMATDIREDLERQVQSSVDYELSKLVKKVSIEEKDESGEQ